MACMEDREKTAIEISWSKRHAIVLAFLAIDIIIVGIDICHDTSKIDSALVARAAVDLQPGSSLNNSR